MIRLEMPQHLLEVELVNQGAADRAAGVVLGGVLQWCDGKADHTHGNA
jgi:hypothetical protein